MNTQGWVVQVPDEHQLTMVCDGMRARVRAASAGGLCVCLTAFVTASSISEQCTLPHQQGELLVSFYVLAGSLALIASLMGFVGLLVAPAPDTSGEYTNNRVLSTVIAVVLATPVVIISTAGVTKTLFVLTCVSALGKGMAIATLFNCGLCFFVVYR